jgi:hypothetical protein
VPKDEDAFPEPVVRALELATGTRCSAPFCRKGTTGVGSGGKVVRIGVAAHITARSKRGPRYDASFLSEERSSGSNGIWMCQDHARLIDVDDPRYPVELLREWKRIAEQRPLADAQGHGEFLYDLVSFSRHIAISDPTDLPKLISEWSQDIGVEHTWGTRHAQAIEALVVETLLNASQHSSPPATSALLNSHGRELSVEYRGLRFGVDELQQVDNPGGGSQVLKLVREELAQSLGVTHTFRDGVNAWHVSLEQWPNDGCLWEVTKSPSDVDLSRLAGCDAVRLTLGGASLMISAPRRLLHEFARAGITRVVVIDVSDSHILADAIKESAAASGVALTFLGMPQRRRGDETDL